MPKAKPNESEKDSKGTSVVLNKDSKKSKKETKHCFVPISFKEDDSEFYSEGYVASTHPDRAADDELGVDGDILSKNVIHQIVDYINDGVATTSSIGSTRAVSLGHDWIREQDADKLPAGMAVPPAEIKETEDGHYGAHVKTHHNKNHPKYDQIIYDVKHGYLPGYSIEYNPGEYDIIEINNKHYRFLKTITNFVGYAFADARKIANPAALISGFGYKEIEDKFKEDNNKMGDEKPIEEPKPEVEVEKKEEAMTTEKPKEEVTKEDVIEETPEEESGEEPEEKQIKKIVTQIKESKEFKDALKSVKVDSKVINTGLKEDNTMKDTFCIKELNEALKEKDVWQFNSIVEQEKLIDKAMEEPKSYQSRNSSLNVKCIGKGLKIMGGLQVKGTLDTGDNASTYTQSSVEFADLFAPGIIDTFNNQTNYLGFIRKEQNPGGYFYQWKMIINKDPESNDTFVQRDETSIAKNWSDKNNYQTPLKVARRGVSVTDFALRYSAQSLGDLFMTEVDTQTKELLNVVDAALFAEVADGTGAACLGLEAVADSAGNGTLYGFTRSTTNRLSPAAAADTYVLVSGNLTEDALRNGITKLRVAGSQDADIAIVTHPLSKDFILNLLDTNRRFNTTEASFGFNQKMVASFDGFPIISDHNCNVDAIYVVDQSSGVLVMGMEPRVISLAKVGAATEAYVEMHFAHVYKEPRKIHMLDGLTGP